MDFLHNPCQNSSIEKCFKLALGIAHLASLSLFQMDKRHKRPSLNSLITLLKRWWTYTTSWEPLFQSGVPQPGCQTGKECKQLFPSFSMLGLVGAKPPSTWTPVRGDALSPSLLTLAIQELSSFLHLLQLLPSNATVDGLTKNATDSVLLLTKQLRKQQSKLLQLPSPLLLLFQQQQLLPLLQWRLSPQLLHQLLTPLPLLQWHLPLLVLQWCLPFPLPQVPLFQWRQHLPLHQ